LSILALAMLVLGIWVFLGVLLGIQQYLNESPLGTSHSLSSALDRSIRRYLIYALLTFPCLWLCRRFSFTSRRWLVPLVAHSAGLGAFMLLYAAIRLGVGPGVVSAQTGEALPASLGTGIDLIRSSLFEQFWMYTSMVTAILSIQHYRQLRHRELREADLKRQMAEYELQVLKLQLYPHFLFNTLNGISTLMLRDTATAREMLVRLSDLLRVALARSRDNEVLLRDELEFVKAYLELEQMRFGERLRVSLGIDPRTLEARVPNMLIQPLVENAIQHGIAQLKSGGKLDLTSEIHDRRLLIRIVNDGPVAGLSPSIKGSGLGLGSARLRLSQIYGDAYRLEISDRLEGGADLEVEIPLLGAEAREAAHP
jgi:two-component system, LytTR family, sensor kinase